MKSINSTCNTLSIALRPTVAADLEALFQHQLDDDYAFMAAFVNEHYKDKEAYIAKWNKLLHDKVNIRTIIVDGEIAGSVSTWMLMDDPQLSYGVAKKYWGKGIATNAVQQFLPMVPERPLYGRVAFDNIGSARVLEKCGFRKVDEDAFFAFARKKEIAEYIFRLDA